MIASFRVSIFNGEKFGFNEQGGRWRYKVTLIKMRRSCEEFKKIWEKNSKKL